MPEHATSVITQMINFAERQMSSAKDCAPGSERRTQKRYQPWISQVVVVPVDPTLAPLGEPFAAVTRDISQNGLGLIFEESPAHELYGVLLCVDGDESFVLTQVKWHEHSGPFHGVGVRALKVLSGYQGSARLLCAEKAADFACVQV